MNYLSVKTSVTICTKEREGYTRGKEREGERGREIVRDGGKERKGKRGRERGEKREEK